MILVNDFLADQVVLRRPGGPVAPAVSVVLPTFARLESGGLQRAVESVLSQTFEDFELIVVDDGSTDGSFGFLRDVQAGDARLIVVRHELNSGLPALRVNEGIEVARGRFVAFQFDDDEWVPGALATLLRGAAGDQVVAFGAAEIELASGERVVPLPPMALNEALLSFQNRVANNTVLVPRGAFDLVGMYDCHVVMRRLCDWDLWLRLVRRIPFRPVPDVVSVVRLRHDARAISLSVPWDPVAFRFLHAISRNEALAPARWRGYEVDSLSPLGLCPPAAMRVRIAEEQVLPFRHRMKKAGLAAARDESTETGVTASPKTLLWTSDAFYPPWAHFLSLYDRVSAPRSGYKAFYQPLVQLEDEWTEDADLLLLVRSTTGPGCTAVDKAIAAGVPVGYFLDDDLLHMHEQDPAWARMAPGAADRESFLDQLRRADVVWTNPYLAGRISSINPRSVPHNAAIEERMLPVQLRRRAEDGPVRIGYVGGGYREEEFQLLWPVFERLAREFPDRARFEFWGLDRHCLPALPAPVTSRPFEQSMGAFLEELREAKFDILLTPLLDYPAPRLAKTPSKYHLCAVAGALGIYSDVPPYRSLPEGVTCLRAANDRESWYRTLEEALTMPAARFDALRRAAIEHVRLELTSEVLVDLHEAACRAIEFHARTRSCRTPEGRPRVMVVPSDSEDSQPSHEVAGLLRHYGIAAEVRNGEANGLGSEAPALVHLRWREPKPKPLAACETVSIEDEVTTGPGRLIPERIFACGLDRILRLWSEVDTDGAVLNGRYVLVVPPGPVDVRSFVEQLAPRLAARGLELLVHRSPSPEDVARAALCVSSGESLQRVGPTSWSAASAVPHVWFNTGAVADWSLQVQAIESCLDERRAARAERVRAAYVAARRELHPQVVANRLLAAYNAVLVPSSAHAEARNPPAAASDGPAPVTHPPTPLADAFRATSDRLRHHADQLGLYRPLSRLAWSRRRRRVLVVYDNPTVSTHLYYGAVVPDLEAATSRRWVIRPSDEVRPEDLYSFHAVVFQRAVSERSLEILDAARREGCRTLYDADDNLLLIDQVIDDPEHPWRVYFGGARDRLARLLSGVDRIKVYSPSAVPHFAPHNPNVTPIRPFHLLPDEDPVPAGRERPVRVGFLGSYYKDADFAPLVPLIRELLDGDYPLAFEFFGFCPEGLADDPRVTRLAWEPDYGRFRARLLERRWEIGLAPLRELDFNRCKTNIKYREYAASGIAGIYSRAEIYRTSVEDRRTGLLVPQESGAAWREAILELAENPMLRHWLARNALADLRANYRLEDYVAAVAALVG